MIKPNVSKPDVLDRHQFWCTRLGKAVKNEESVLVETNGLPDNAVEEAVYYFDKHPEELGGGCGVDSDTCDSMEVCVEDFKGKKWIFHMRADKCWSSVTKALLDV